MTAPRLHPFSLDRMVRAVEKVRERLLRATAALETAGVPYAVAGGNAVSVWVARSYPWRSLPLIRMARPSLFSLLFAGACRC